MGFTRSEALEILREIDLLEMSMEVLRDRAIEALQPPKLRVVENEQRRPPQTSRRMS